MRRGYRERRGRGRRRIGSRRRRCARKPNSQPANSQPSSQAAARHPTPLSYLCVCVCVRALSRQVRAREEREMRASVALQQREAEDAHAAAEVLRERLGTAEQEVHRLNSELQRCRADAVAEGERARLELQKAQEAEGLYTDAARAVAASLQQLNLEAQSFVSNNNAAAGLVGGGGNPIAAVASAAAASATMLPTTHQQPQPSPPPPPPQQQLQLPLPPSTLGRYLQADGGGTAAAAAAESSAMIRVLCNELYEARAGLGLFPGGAEAARGGTTCTQHAQQRNITLDCACTATSPHPLSSSTLLHPLSLLLHTQVRLQELLTMRMSQMASNMRQQQQTAAYRQQSALPPQAPVLPLAASSSTQQPQQQPGSSLSGFQQPPLPGQVQRQVSDDSNSKARRMTPQTAAPMRATPFALNASHLEAKDEYREEVRVSAAQQ